jgi:uncharacterized protein with GYD domain
MTLRKLLAVLCIPIGLSVSVLAKPEESVRHFMFVGEPSTEAWEMLARNPVDRRKAVETAFSKLGGEILGYYFGLGDGKNYITVTLPDDNEVIQAVYLMRMSTGLLKSYQVIELMRSDQMADALRKSNEYIRMEQEMATKR